MARELYHALDETDRVLRAYFDPMAHAFIGALRLGVAVALVVAATVEIAANPNGMGYAMMIAQQSLDPALLLAWLGWIGVVGFVINAAALWLQRRVARRMGVQS